MSEQVVFHWIIEKYMLTSMYSKYSTYKISITKIVSQSPIVLLMSYYFFFLYTEQMALL